MSGRPSNRRSDELRPIKITRRFTRHAEGSVLVEFGDTRVICNASIENRVPRFLKGSGSGWITAEYAMLPRSTNTRMMREASRGRQSGRTLEIQRLIGRSLRAAVDMQKLGERSVTIDCDVIQADGGTRTASITGGFVALHDALENLVRKNEMTTLPVQFFVASVSVGMYRGEAVLDLDYPEDSEAETDMNVVMTEHGDLIEIQGTAEARPFPRRDMDRMLDLAEHGIRQLIESQQRAIHHDD